MISAWISDLKVESGCVDCGATHPAILDYHHINPSEKEYSIANSVKNGWSKERILKEIEKCVVLCANCHRIRHSSFE